MKKIVYWHFTLKALSLLILVLLLFVYQSEAQTPIDYPLKPWEQWYAISDFGVHRSGINEGYHSGVDLALKTPSTKDGLGKPVHAIADGELFKVDDLKARGWSIVIRHTLTEQKFIIPEHTQEYQYKQEEVPTIFSVYIHIQPIDKLKKIITKPNGVDVKKGDVIGYIMEFGGVPHLHFEIRHQNADNSNKGSMLYPTSNWAPNGTTNNNGHYLNMQILVESGARNPLEFLEANLQNASDISQEFSQYTLPKEPFSRLGKGSVNLDPQSVVFSPDSTMLAVATSIGVYLCNSITFEEIAFFETKIWMNSVTFSPNSNLLAIWSENEDMIKLWDIKSRKEISILSGHGPVAFSPDGNLLASKSKDGIKLWDVKTYKEITVLKGVEFTLSSDGNLLAIWSFEEGEVKLWDIKSHKEVALLDGCGPVVFSPDSKLLASAKDSTKDKDEVKLWDVKTFKEIITFKGEQRPDEFSPDGSVLAIWGMGGVNLWDMKTYKKIATLEEYQSVTFSPDGSLLADARFPGIAVLLWDTRIRKEIANFEWYGNAAFSPDGRLLAIWGGSGGDRSGVKLWDVKNRKENATINKFSDLGGGSVAFSPNGKLLASGGNDTVTLWNVNNNKEVDIFKGESWRASASFAFSPDGNMIAIGSGGTPWHVEDTTVRLWDIKNHKKIANFGGDAGDIYSVAFSPDGKLLASASLVNMVNIWDVKSGKEIAILKGGSGINTGRSVAFSPNGSMLASGAEDGTVKLWNVKTFREITTIKGNLKHPVGTVVFSPDGLILASESDDGIKLWDVKTYNEITEIKGTNIAAFSPDGKILASGAGKEIKLWNVKSLKEIATLKGHLDEVISVAFNYDGSLLASGSGDGTVLLWDMTGGSRKNLSETMDDNSRW